MIHELGHNLGLDHFGNPDESDGPYNYKPHYVSLMNYAYEWCSPNALAEDDVLRACDPDFLRFSEGERRYVLDENGNRVKDQSGKDVLINLDPSSLAEFVPFYNVVRTYPGGRSSTVVNDLMWGVGRFFVL